MSLYELMLSFPCAIKIGTGSFLINGPDDWIPG